jgi:cobalt-zinc-cadmium efflux system protein
MTWQHQASRPASQRALLLALAITVSFLVAEVVGGVLTNSLALLADAGHMLSDVAALGLGIFAIWIAMRPATATRTYGFHRVEVLAALANGVMLVAIAIYIFWQAGHRLQEPPEVRSLPMLLVATAGLGANAASGSLLYRHSKDSLNVRGAFLHVLADALGSAGAICAGVIMLTTGWYRADAIASVFIGVLVLVSSWRLLRESLGVLLEAVPPHMDAKEIESALKEVAGVEGVHDLHVWTVTSGFIALTCHAELNDSCDIQEVLEELCQMLHERHGIRHVTIQPEVIGMRGSTAHRPLPRCHSLSDGGCEE